MSDDLIDEFFSEMDEYYPGSKRKRREIKEKPKPQETKTWDSRPYVKPLNGKDVEFFTIGALAEALGRPIITIRYWIDNGYIPTSTYKMPSTIDKNGDKRQGRWLYTRAMIDSAVDVFTRNGLRDVVRIDWSKNKQVSQALAEAWSNLRITENNNQ